MANIIDLNSLTNTLPAIPKLPGSRKTGKSSAFAFKKTGEFQEPGLAQITRRMTLGFTVSVGLTGIFGKHNVSLAQNNGFWIDGPLPIPPIYNSKHHFVPNSWFLVENSIPLSRFLIVFWWKKSWINPKSLKLLSQTTNQDENSVWLQYRELLIQFPVLFFSDSCVYRYHKRADRNEIVLEERSVCSWYRDERKNV